MIPRILMFSALMGGLLLIAEDIQPPKTPPKDLTSEEQLQVVRLSLDKATAAGKQIVAIRAMENAQRAYEDAKRDWMDSTAKLNSIQDKLTKLNSEKVAAYHAEGYVLTEDGNWIEEKKQ